MPSSELLKKETLRLLGGSSLVISVLIHKIRYVIEFPVIFLENSCFEKLTFMQDGITAVSYAAQNGHSDIVILLINANADINLPDKVMVILIQSAPFCDFRVTDFFILLYNY